MAGTSFNISSKDIIVQYANDLITVPILLNGSGTDNIISFDDAEVADKRPTADGNYASWVKAAISSGKLTFTGTAPSITQFLNVMQQQNLIGGAIEGNIIISNPGGLALYTIYGVVLTAAPPAPTFGAEIKDFNISFKCNAFANISTLGAIINTATSIAAII